jgi:hypothetical protein
MRLAFFLLYLTLAAMAGGTASALTGDHYDVRHCEIFVDKVQAYVSSHGAHGITFYLKTLNDRLDSEITEIGIRQQVTTRSHYGNEQSVSDWYDEKAQNWFGADDYFRLSVYLGSEFSSRLAEGIFFVRTRLGTTYWLRGRDGRNFRLNDTLFYTVRDLYYSPRYSFFDMVPTQSELVLAELNPDFCY